ncbi:CEP164 [Symbiodinium necroappetens]|uniref:CEP164 protein n=1 Tax=Symbiodinium necroappetens TaxID=1628268 RepID=A0A813A1J5_9DINO|nr:CEP164 [Symbiodinium necroappetens]
MRGVDIAAQTSEASEADFKEPGYAKSLGVELEKDVDLVWVAREAFEAPLPASWSEHLDQERRIYFFNQVTQQSSWNHPMDEVFRDLIHLIKSVRRLDPPEASVVEAVQTHLQSCHDRASAALEGWSGPYAAEDGEYFYHAEQGASTWHNPVEEWQTELSVRQQAPGPGLGLGDPRGGASPRCSTAVCSTRALPARWGKFSFLVCWYL